MFRALTIGSVSIRTVPPRLTQPAAGRYPDSVPQPICRYRVPGLFLWLGIGTFALTAVSIWLALSWPLYFMPAGIFLASTIVALYLASRPPIEIHESHLKIGRAAIAWKQIRRLDRSANLPLTIRLTLADKTKVMVVFPGDPNSSSGLLRSLRRHAREALIDGVPYRQFWGEATSAAAARRQLAAPYYPLMLPDDEAEIERLFQRLKSVGHLDQKTSSEDK
jgi:hypothetical protein